MSESLKPCPLCHSEQTRPGYDRMGVRTIYCDACKCQAPETAWNRRPSPPGSPAPEPVDWSVVAELAEQIFVKAHDIGARPVVMRSTRDDVPVGPCKPLAHTTTKGKK